MKESLGLGLAKYFLKMKNPSWDVIARYKECVYSKYSEFGVNDCKDAVWKEEDSRCVRCIPKW